MKADLHTHSTFSDGTNTPAELVGSAKAAGIEVLALTDHNTFEGLGDFMEAGRLAGLKTVPGTEVSTSWKNPFTGEVSEVHIVGLNVPLEGSEEINKILSDYARRKEESNILLEAALKNKGIDVSLDEMKEASPAGNINRAIFAKEMMRKGYVKSIKRAFDDYLMPEQGLYVEPERPDVQEAVYALKKAGATVVLAHPMLTFEKEEEPRALLDEVEGIDAIEAYYPTYTEEDTKEMEKLAEEKGLYKSGGSDYHGTVKPRVFVGSAFCDSSWLK